mmetsp:Transcript_14220/g.35987  ORF Transcript_14220/g.35987 Transcript_14220/m.35987 type:complete len:214 (-) Transcript_14220:784-1425(-)
MASCEQHHSPREEARPSLQRMRHAAQMVIIAQRFMTGRPSAHAPKRNASAVGDFAFSSSLESHLALLGAERMASVAVTQKCSPRKSAPSGTLRAQLKVGDWNAFNVFKVYSLSHGQPLKAVTQFLVEDFGLVASLNIPMGNLVAFLERLERTYYANSYHNNLHAAEVTHACAWLVSKCHALDVVFEPHEILALLLAAAAHDAGNGLVATANCP